MVTGIRARVSSLILLATVAIALLTCRPRTSEESGARTFRSAEMPLPGLISDARRFEQHSNQGRFEALKALLRERDLDFEVQQIVNEGDGGEFSHQGSNVVLTYGRGDRALVVGAHFDAAGSPEGKIGPGMVDNAAGVVVLIRLAQAIQNYWFNHRIYIVFFDLEETGQVGSEQYVASVGSYRIEAMINVDIVGYGDTAIFGPLSGNEQVRLARAVQSVCSRLSIDCISSPLLPAGDFRSFEAAGVPSISLAILPSAEAHQVWLMFNKAEESGLHDGFVPRIGRVVHTSDDTADRLDPAAMTMAYNLIGSLLVELDRPQDEADIWMLALSEQE